MITLKNLKQKFKHRSKRGDTLIEVIFALVIIGFIIMVAIQGALNANRAARDAQLRTQGQLWATAQIEVIRVIRNARFWSDVEGDPGNFVQNQLVTNFHIPVGTLVGSDFVCPPGPPPADALDSWPFHARIDDGTGSPDLVSGSEVFESYTIKNTARLTNCPKYHNDSVEVTTEVTWLNSAGGTETVRLINYLTRESKDS